MRGRERMHVVDFPVRGAPAVERHSVPRRHAFFDVGAGNGRLPFVGGRRTRSRRRRTGLRRGGCRRGNWRRSSSDRSVMGATFEGKNKEQERTCAPESFRDAKKPCLARTKSGYRNVPIGKPLHRTVRSHADSRLAGLLSFSPCIIRTHLLSRKEPDWTFLLVCAGNSIVFANK